MESTPAPTTDKLTVANIKVRLKGPTPQIFKTLGKIFVAMVSIGSAVIASTIGLPITLPSIVTTIAAYMIVGGTVGKSITSLTTTQPPGTVQENNVSDSK